MKKLGMILGFIFILFTIPIGFGEIAYQEIEAVKLPGSSKEYLPLKKSIEAAKGTVLYDAKQKEILVTYHGREFTFSTTKHKIKIDNLEYNALNDIVVRKGISYISKSLFKNIVGEDDPRLNDYKPTLIAHGGGEIKGYKITNSREAILEAMAHNVQHIEIDFLVHFQGDIVLGHDWGTVHSYFRNTLSNKEIEVFRAAKNDVFSTLVLHDLIELLDEHRGLKIITDTKEADNIKLLHQIANRYPDYLSRFIPQIYSMEEYPSVRALGYKDVIYSLYKVYKTDDEIIKFISENDLFALTMTASRATPRFIERINQVGVHTYVHTINDVSEFEALSRIGVSGVYTDNLYFSE